MQLITFVLIKKGQNETENGSDCICINNMAFKALA